MRKVGSNQKHLKCYGIDKSQKERYPGLESHVIAHNIHTVQQFIQKKSAHNLIKQPIIIETH